MLDEVDQLLAPQVRPQLLLPQTVQWRLPAVVHPVWWQPCSGSCRVHPVW